MIVHRLRGLFLGDFHVFNAKQQGQERHSNGHTAGCLFEIHTPFIGIDVISQFINPGKGMHYQCFPERFILESVLIYARGVLF